MSIPLMNSWTRVEALPIDPSLVQGLQAQTADPLWMLTRQWQFGELAGEDAGSPAAVHVVGTVDRLTRFAPHLPNGDPGIVLDVGSVPLEALVEVEQQPADAESAPAFAARAGLHAVRLLKAAFAGTATAAEQATYVDALVNSFPLAPQPKTADPVLQLSVGRVPDGQAFYDAIAAGLRAAVPKLPAIPPLGGLDPEILKRSLIQFLGWYDAVSGRALPQADAWVPSRVEYQFSVSAATSQGELVLAAQEYDSGSLDWYSLDVVPHATLGAVDNDQGARRSTLKHTGVPAAVSYRGMPSSRWWQLEDARVDLGDVSTPAEELATMLVVDFALRYSNDFFMLPFPLDVGSVARINALVVQDTFGTRFLIDHVSRVDGPTGAFRMFEHSTPVGAARESAFVLLPVLDESIQGQPVEDVRLFRDEPANLAWAVEQVAYGPDGTVADRAAARQASRRAAQDQPTSDDTAPTLAGAVRVYDYRVRTDVADNWYPLVPVESTAVGDPTLHLGFVQPLDGGTPPQPWGRLLGEIGAVAMPFEEVPRDGVRVVRAWQYARWTDGRALAWVGRRSRPGRGEGVSGLRFDIAEPRQ